jgi:hypothetical protein
VLGLVEMPFGFDRIRDILIADANPSGNSSLKKLPAFGAMGALGQIMSAGFQNDSPPDFPYLYHSIFFPEILIFAVFVFLALSCFNMIPFKIIVNNILKRSQALLKRGMPLAEVLAMTLVSTITLLLTIVPGFAAPQKAPETLVTPSGSVSFSQAKISGLRYSVIKADLGNPNIKVKPALAWDRVGEVEPVYSIASRNPGTVAAVNAGFFDVDKTNQPIGMIMIDGRIVSWNMGPWNRAVIIFDTQNHAQIIRTNERLHLKLFIHGKEDKWFYINGVNEFRHKNEAVIYTPEYGPTTRIKRPGVDIVVENNVVVKIIENGHNVEIPKNGYVISMEGGARKQFARLFAEGDCLNMVTG